MQGEQGNSYQRISQNTNTSKENMNYVPGILKVNESPGSKTHKETKKHPQIIALTLPLVAPMY